MAAMKFKKSSGQGETRGQMGSHLRSARTRFLGQATRRGNGDS